MVVADYFSMFAEFFWGAGIASIHPSTCSRNNTGKTTKHYSKFGNFYIISLYQEFEYRKSPIPLYALDISYHLHSTCIGVLALVIIDDLMPHS